MPILRPAVRLAVDPARAGRQARRGAGLDAAEELGAWAAWQSAAARRPEAVARARRRRPACAAAAAPATRPPTSGAPCARSPPRVRYVVANGYEADPARRLDRTLMETDPHAVVEGAGHRRVRRRRDGGDPRRPRRYDRRHRAAPAALEAAEAAGYIGADVLGTGVTSCDDPGPAAAGRATCWARRPSCSRPSRASAASPSSGRRTPPSAASSARPTVGQQRRHARARAVDPRQRRQAYVRRSAIRTSPGTVLVQLSGAVHRPAASPRSRPGTPLARVVDLAGGGATGARSRRCWSAGRRAASCRPTALDTPLRARRARGGRGAILGSGSVVVADEHACIVDLATLLTRFCTDEACGKTHPLPHRHCAGWPRSASGS